MKLSGTLDMIGGGSTALGRPSVGAARRLRGSDQPVPSAYRVGRGFGGGNRQVEPHHRLWDLLDRIKARNRVDYSNSRASAPPACHPTAAAAGCCLGGGDGSRWALGQQPERHRLEVCALES